MLRGAIFGRFSVNSTTLKLPGNYPDPALKKRNLPRPAWTRPRPGNFGLIHTLTDSN